MSVSGPQGGPFSPSSFQYRVSSSSGTINYSVRTPSWLTVSSTVGVTDMSGVTITITVSSAASRLPPGTYGPSVAFTNVTNGRGSAARSATLIIQGPSPGPPPSTGRLLDRRAKDIYWMTVIRSCWRGECQSLTFCAPRQRLQLKWNFAGIGSTMDSARFRPNGACERLSWPMR